MIHDNTLISTLGLTSTDSEEKLDGGRIRQVEESQNWRTENSGCAVFLERSSGQEGSQMEKQALTAQALSRVQELTSGSLGKHSLALYAEV